MQSCMEFIYRSLEMVLKTCLFSVLFCTLKNWFGFIVLGMCCCCCDRSLKTFVASKCLNLFHAIYSGSGWVDTGHSYLHIYYMSVMSYVYILHISAPFLLMAVEYPMNHIFYAYLFIVLFHFHKSEEKQDY